jgi:hypothetical protein
MQSTPHPSHAQPPVLKVIPFASRCMLAEEDEEEENWMI